jgi:ribosomal protein S18 acetylase RimI-like enzyme
MIRPAGPQDVRFLRDMLHHAFYRRETPTGDEEQPTYRYVAAWGRKGDAGVIAIDEGFPVGAAWYRLFREGEPGYGFVGEETPELAIAVVPSRRGRGLGSELLEALMDRARKEGFAALSLSVESDNPAIHLYESFGFRRVRENGTHVTMQADLSSERQA